MKPTRILLDRTKARIRFTTKQVGKGFYRGNRVGSLGAHTPYGGYLIDYRKVPHFVVPNLANHDQLNPYVTTYVPADSYEPVDERGDPFTSTNWHKYLIWSKEKDPETYKWYLDNDGGRQAEPEEAQEEAREEPAQALFTKDGMSHTANSPIIFESEPTTTRQKAT